MNVREEMLIEELRLNEFQLSPSSAILTAIIKI